MSNRNASRALPGSARTVRHCLPLKRRDATLTEGIGATLPLNILHSSFMRRSQ